MALYRDGMNDLSRLIRQIAVVPSFSSYEERIHPCILDLMETVDGAVRYRVADNNLVFTVPGNRQRKPVALSAHLDKINHFGEAWPDELPFQETDGKLTGQLDNAVGLAVCMELARISKEHSFPPLILLFSEMEESFGLKHHPHLLKNDGRGRHHGLGAERISRFLKNEGMLPSAVITIDTTPLFKGRPGVALYSRHWEFTGKEPGKREKEETARIKEEFLALNRDTLLSNNTNDYLRYGALLNDDEGQPVPSLALEPAIFPYHQKDESVYLKDINKVLDMMTRWLEGRE